MNRTIRRQQERQEAKKAVTYNYNPYQIDAKINNAVAEFAVPIRKETTKEVVNAMLAIYAVSLEAEFGFKKKRIARLLERAKLQFRCIETGYVSLKDILQQCKELKVLIDDITEV